MEYREIKVKGILNTVRGEDEWFGLKYNLNLYRGCEHQCIYCDTRSACYQIENFNEEVLVKVNALELLEDALPRKRKVGFVGFGSMNDPYTPAEKVYGLTGRALEIVARHHFPVHIITKSDLVLKDLEILQEINTVKARVSFTLTTIDDDLAAILEPGAPSPSQRLAVMKQLAAAGIETGVVMMPILPFIEDTPENILGVVESAAVHSAAYIIPAFGVSVREGQREYFYRQLDVHFPGVRKMYEQTFGRQYQCPAQNQEELARMFYDACKKLGLRTRVYSYPENPETQQLSLF